MKEEIKRHIKPNEVKSASLNSYKSREAVKRISRAYMMAKIYTRSVKGDVEFLSILE